jgi:hypothetical protein
MKRKTKDVTGSAKACPDSHAHSEGIAPQSNGNQSCLNELQGSPRLSSPRHHAYQHLSSRSTIREKVKRADSKEKKRAEPTLE